MEGFDMSDVQSWVVGVTDALDHLVPDERITLDLDSLRKCINDHVVQTVFPLTEDCVPETTRTLSLAVVADATFRPGKEAVLFDGTIFVNPRNSIYCCAKRTLASCPALRTSAPTRRASDANVASAWRVQSTMRFLQREPRCAICVHHNWRSNGLELETTNEHKSLFRYWFDHISQNFRGVISIIICEYDAAFTICWSF
jgi:hypothetical protein